MQVGEGLDKSLDVKPHKLAISRLQSGFNVLHVG